MSFELSQTLKLTAGILLVAAVAAPSTVYSQRAADRQRQIVESIEQDRTQNGSQPELVHLASDEQQQIIEKLHEEIQAIQLQNGSNSPDLIDPLTALGVLYQEGGDHSPAVAAIEQALHIVHVNYGFSSIDQATLIRILIHSEEAIRNFSVAWNLEQELLTLAKRHPDDLRTVPIFRELAEKRMDLLQRYSDGEFPPQIVLGCYYQPIRKQACTSGRRSSAISAIVSDALGNYADAINVFRRNELYSSDTLRELEMELARIAYRYGRPHISEQSLRRLLSYADRISAPELSRINALIHEADWGLLYSDSRARNESALSTYEQAYELLKEERMAQASIEQIFSPKTPVVLPAFMPNPLVSEETEKSTGYIDVAFEVTKHGKSRRIRILDTTNNSTRAAKNRLVRLLKQSRFRPRVTDGLFADTSPIVVRYYLND